MALEQITFNIASFNDVDAAGNNYYAGVVYEVFNINDTLADIYTDAAGTIPIIQDGINNVSNSEGELELYIQEGVYYLLVGSKRRDFTAGFNDLVLINDPTLTHTFEDIDSMIASTIAFPVKKVIEVKEDDSTWDVALSSAVTTNGDNKRVSVGYPTNSFVVRSPLVYDVIIAYGQSNIVGYAGQPGVPAVDDIATPVGNRYAKNYDPVTDSIIPVSNTMKNLNYAEDGGGGSRGNAWTAFANKWIKETGRGCIVINAGRGGASVNELSKGVGTGVTDYYGIMTSGYVSTVAAMSTQGYDLGSTYAVWHQGETDQSLSTATTVYRDALNLIAQNMIADIAPLEKFGVMIVGCPGSRVPASWEVIQSAQWAATRYGAGAGFTNNMAVITDICPTFTETNGDYNPADDTHYSQRGYNRMGESAASGLLDWVNQDSTSSGSPVDQGHQASISGTGRFSMKHISAIAVFDGPNWSLQQGTAGTNAAYLVSNARSVTTATDALTFRVAGKNPIIYDMQAEVSALGKIHRITPDIRRYFNSFDDLGFYVYFYADISFGIKLSDGSLFSDWPLAAASSFINSIITVTANAVGQATFSHPVCEQSPVISYYSSASLETAQCGVRGASSTSTTVTTNGVNDIVIVDMKRLQLTMSQLEALAGTGNFEVRINATMSDNV